MALPPARDASNAHAAARLLRVVPELLLPPRLLRVLLVLPGLRFFAARAAPALEALVEAARLAPLHALPLLLFHGSDLLAHRYTGGEEGPKPLGMAGNGRADDHLG